MYVDVAINCNWDAHMLPWWAPGRPMTLQPPLKLVVGTEVVKDANNNESCDLITLPCGRVGQGVP